MSLESIKSRLSTWAQNLAPGTFLGRRAYAQILYAPAEAEDYIAPTDISEQIMQYLLSIDFTDNLSGQVDDITITLEDRARLWQDGWYPEPGARMDITIFTLNEDGLTEGIKLLELGEFEIDEIEIRSMPTTVQIKAVNALQDTSLRGVKENRTWENVNLQKIASDIAGKNNMTVEYEPDDTNNPLLTHVEQSDESDLEFLKKLCGDAGLDVKISARTIILIDEEKLEEQEPLIMFWRPGTASFSSQTSDEDASPENPINFVEFTSYSLKAKTRDIYKACHVKYKQGKDKQVVEGYFSAPGKEQGQVLEVNEQVDNKEAAEKLAKKKLREQNRDEMTATFSMRGDFHFMAGTVLQLINFGVFDGRYIVTKAAHSLGNGYLLNLDMRKCLDGY